MFCTLSRRAVEGLWTGAATRKRCHAACPVSCVSPVLSCPVLPATILCCPVFLVSVRVSPRPLRTAPHRSLTSATAAFALLWPRTAAPDYCSPAAHSLVWRLLIYDYEHSSIRAVTRCLSPARLPACLHSSAHLHCDLHNTYIVIAIIQHRLRDHRSLGPAAAICPRARPFLLHHLPPVDHDPSTSERMRTCYHHHHLSTAINTPAHCLCETSLTPTRAPNAPA